MPCNSDHMEPNRHEAESKLACQLLAYALPLAGQALPSWIAAGAKDYYGAPRRLKEATVMLCTLCRTMDESQKEKVIYDGRNPDARKLADWWDEHQKADAVREQREKEATEKAEIQAQALKKLTAEEKAALRLNP